MKAFARWLFCRVLVWHDWIVMRGGPVSVRCGRCGCAYWQFQRDDDDENRQR